MRKISTTVAAIFAVALLALPGTARGLNVAHASAGMVDDTELGLNLVGGSKFDAEGLTPFVEARVEIEGGEQFVLTGGLLFP